MRPDQRAAYVELVKAAEPLYRQLRKDEVNPSGLVDAHDPKVARVLRDILASARRRFLLAFKPGDLDALREDARAALERAFPAELSTKLVDALANVASDLIDHNVATYSLEIDVEQANSAAIGFLRDRVDNVFSSLSDAQAKSVYDAISQAKSEEHTLDDVTAAVKGVVGRELSWETADGTRTMDVDTWAELTARTEGTRAATAGTRAALVAGGYETWRWLAEGGACDDCAGNDDEVVEIGEAFSSGDTESPAHPGCRCPVIPNVVELTGDDENPDEQDDPEASDQGY
jgi:hypothetical protein